jgi:hypothetical protein
MARIWYKTSSTFAIRQKELPFVDAVWVLAVFKNHRTDKILFHTDVNSFIGPYWEKVKNTPRIVHEFPKVTITHTTYNF